MNLSKPCVPQLLAQAGWGQVPLWAPKCNEVQVCLDPNDPEKQLPMRPGDEGWFYLPTPLADGQPYAYRIDGKGPFPDPRGREYLGVNSCWNRTANPRQLSQKVTLSTQLSGKGDARADRHGAKLKLAGCAPGLAGFDPLGEVWYELHVGTFTPQGTLRSAMQQLDYLADLGIKMVELMPTAYFPGHRGWGYDGVGLYALHPSYGSALDLVRFVDRAHQLGIGICQDLVLNHLGPEGNYWQLYGPYFSDKHQTPWGDGYNLDGEGSKYVREFLIGAALSLLTDYGFDALRLDAVHAITDDSDYHLLSELSDRVKQLEKQLGRRLTLVAESDLNDPIMLSPTQTGGYGMDGQWDDDVHHALHVAFTGETHGYYGDFADPNALQKTFEQVFYHNGTYSTFRKRHWGKPVSSQVKAKRFVVSTSNHDQVGNRALGDRPASHLPAGLLAGQAALLLAAPFTPMLFQGEEWGATTFFQYFTDYPDPKLGRAVSKGRKEEFASHGWEEIYGHQVEVPDPQAEETFLRSKLDWSQLKETSHQQLWNWFRLLIYLRQQGVFQLGKVARPQLKRANLICLSLPSAQVAVNLSPDPLGFSVGDTKTDCSGKQIKASWWSLEWEDFISHAPFPTDPASLLSSCASELQVPIDFRVPAHSVAVFLRHLPQVSNLTRT